MVGGHGRYFQMSGLPSEQKLGYYGPDILYAEEKLGWSTTCQRVQGHENLLL